MNKYMTDPIPDPWTMLAVMGYSQT